MIKALFFDIDGTLVSFRTHRMSDEVKKTLRTLQSRGVKLFISSGRAFCMMSNLEEYPFDGYITMNGALTMMGGEIIDSHPFPQDLTLKVARICRERGISCWTFTRDDVRLNMPSDQVMEMADKLQFYPKELIDMEKVSLEEPIYQYTIYVSAEEEKCLLHPLLEHVEYPRWHPYFADIVSQGLTKSYGAQKILERLGIGREECMAFGDGGNDSPIIEYAGIGVAMGNAEDAVKAVADYVTDSVDDDGVISALRHFDVL